MKNTIITRKCIVLYLLIFSVMAFFLTSSFVEAHKKSHIKKPCFQKTISRIQIGKTFRYRLKGNSKKFSIRFYSNHPKYARIHKKKGILRARKKGTVTITARIHDSKIKRNYCIRTRVKIVAKKHSKNASSIQNRNTKRLLKNVQITPAFRINPWNHSLILYSSRVLLSSEVSDSSLVLHPSSDPIKLNARFSNLSADGKIITYTLSDSAAAYLSPGNGSRNGIYRMTSSLFSDTFSIQYQERIGSGTLSGFILSQSGKPVSSAKVTVKDSSGKILTPYSVSTGKEGYYSFSHLPFHTANLTVIHKDYQSQTVTKISLTCKAQCETVILHPHCEKNLALSCQVTDSQGFPLPDINITLSCGENLPSFHGSTDHQGMLTISNSQSLSDNGYSKVSIQESQNKPVLQTSPMPHSLTIFTSEQTGILLNRRTVFQLMVNAPPATSSLHSDSTNLSYSKASISFSFSSLLSDHFYLQIALSKIPPLVCEDLSIKWDSESNLNACHSLELTLYDPSGRKSLFQYHWEQPSPSSNLLSLNNTPFSSQLLKKQLRLPDGTYYIKLQDYNKTGAPLSAPSINSVKVKNSYLQKCTIILHATVGMRILACGDFSDKWSNTAIPITCRLYQSCNNLWLPIGDFKSTTFSTFSESLKLSKAFLSLPCLEPGKNYLLTSHDPFFSLKEDFFFSAHSENTTPTLTDSTVPSGQISCIYHAPDSDELLGKNITIHNTSPFSFSEKVTDPNNQSNMTTYILDAHYFRSSVTYPNTVYALYQKDGTLLTLLYTTTSYTSKSIVFSQTVSYTDYITDIYSNGCSLQTNQLSYRSTPFFVT